VDQKKWSWDDQNALKDAARAINDGHIVIGDTDTVPGLFAACTAKGVAELNAIKGRSDKPYLLLLDSKEALTSFVKQPLLLQAEKLMEAFWPGPLTIILQAQEDVPTYLQSKEGGIAIRIPQDARIAQLAHECGGLLSTSANFSGKPTPKTLDEVDERLLAMAACIMSDPHHEISDTPSTILDATGTEIRVVREGVIPIDELEAAVGIPFIR
jgi:L-threonylcarbamoyladenylate synthase